MMKTSLFAAMLVLAAASSAQAGGQAGTIGLGAEYQLSGAGGASLNYDAGEFHVGGFLGFYDPDGGDNTTFALGARFFYHVHSTAMSDFGVGGGFGLVSAPAPMDERASLVFIEPGIQTRLFLASNVALSFTAGIVIGVVDAGGVAITGQGTGGTEFGSGIGFSGGAGVHYYFF